MSNPNPTEPTPEKSQEEVSQAFYGSFLGVFFALVVLLGNGVHPIINGYRPDDLSSLTFAWMISLIEVIGALPFYFRARSRALKNKGSPQLNFDRQKKLPMKVVLLRMALVGLIFSIATYLYIEGLTLASSISGSIALKTAPIYAMVIGVLFLKEKTDLIQILITLLMFIGLYYLATKGTFRLEGFSVGFVILLIVPFLWSAGHAITKPLLTSGSISIPLVIIIRVGITFIVLLSASWAVEGIDHIFTSLLDPANLLFALAMGGTYLFMHLSWFSSLSKINLSYASSLVIPSPAITAIISVLLGTEPLLGYQITGMVVMFAGLYTLIVYNSKKSKRQS